MGLQSQLPPSLTDLLNRYLQGQTEAQRDGLGFTETTGDVVPHEAVPAQPIDPKQAWDDAVAVVGYFPGLPRAKATVPPDWPKLIGAQEPAVSVAFCMGNSPQLVRNLQPFLDDQKLLCQQVTEEKPNLTGGLLEWANQAKDEPSRLLAAGVLRLVGSFTEAGRLLKGITGPWAIVAANESAALAWYQGKTREALKQWNEQADSTPVLFNRGMAALFLGENDLARKALTAAVAGLPDTSPWHHLGQLYLTLTEDRG